eukprot:3647874-Amphidinium_carterae.1
MCIRDRRLIESNRSWPKIFMFGCTFCPLHSLTAVRGPFQQSRVWQIANGPLSQLGWSSRLLKTVGRRSMIVYLSWLQALDSEVLEQVWPFIASHMRTATSNLSSSWDWGAHSAKRNVWTRRSSSRTL